MTSPIRTTGTTGTIAPFVALAVLAGCAATPPTAPVSETALELEPCRFAPFDELLPELPDGVAEEADGAALCGTLEVWEDRAAAQGRRIGLEIVELPATGPDPAPDPIFLFAGGPGESVTSWGWVPLFFAEARERRDVVLVAQRGTGGSNPLPCPGSSAGGGDGAGDGDHGIQAELEPLLGEGYVERCLAALEGRADLRFYTTAHHVDDVDEVRRALGYERINLWGGSYGTRPSLVYLRRHPASARTATLAGVAHTAWKYPLHHASAGQRALDKLFAACAADADCAAAYPDPRADLEALLALFDERGEARVEIDHPDRPEERVAVTLYRDVVVERLRSLMYRAENAVRIPGLLRRAAASGDLGELAAEVIDYSRAFEEGVSWFSGLWLAVSCSEDAPLISDEDVARATAGTVFGDYRVRVQREACAAWPRGVVPEGFAEPVRSEVPVLIVSGDYDPVTPPSAGEEAARTLANSRHVIVAQGHGATDRACASAVTTAFIEAGTVDGLDVSCLEAVALPPFELPAARAAG